MPPAHHRVTKCDTAREKLLGTIRDLFEVSLTLEENIVPEYLTQQKLRELFICLLLRIYMELFYSVWSTYELQAAQKGGCLTIGY